MSRVQQRSSSPVDTLTDNLAVGAAVGAVMFVVNYVLMYLFITIDGVEGDGGWEFVGNILYNAQFVSTEFSSEAGSVTANFVTGSSSNAIFEALIGELGVGDTIPTILYHLAPIIVLITGGFFVAQQAQAMDIASSAAAGVSIVFGTLVLSIIGVFLFEMSLQGTSGGPEMLMGILLVGIIIPAVAGAIGGAIADQV
jgi:hypothetical protein